MKKLILVIFLSSLVQSAYAVKAQSIYEAEVPIVSQDDQQRDQAILKAFVQTLSKVSGSATVLENPRIKAALPAAKDMVEEYGYASSGLPATPYYLKVQFDPRAIKKLLRQAKAPIWDENRPLILLWLSVANEDPKNAPEVLDAGTNNEWALLLKNEASQRGLPILLPAMDLAELNQVSATDIHNFSLSPLEKAGERYHADGMLIGSIERNGKMRQGHWKLILGSDQWDWTLSAETVPALTHALIDKMIATIGGRYATVQTEKVSSSFTLVIKGVTQQDDFENVMRFIKQISLIKQMEIENIMGDQVVLSLDVQGAQKAFMQDAAVGQHLKLQTEKENELTYLWMP